MCGIVGYIGSRRAAPVLLQGLQRLEYRGYDSAGIAVSGRDGVKIVKRAGRLSALFAATDNGMALEGTAGIGHTRWATHGVPNEANAHPHTAGDGTVTLVHNGIIENYKELKEELSGAGYAFRSETDTEVIAALLDRDYKACGDPLGAISRFMGRARGAYAIAILFRDRPCELYLARKDSPMIVGAGKGEMFAASDVPALLGQTQCVYYMGDLEMARLTADGVSFFAADGRGVTHPPVAVGADASVAEKEGWEHFMIKEIHEQPRAVELTLKRYAGGGTVDFSEAGLSADDLKPSHIVIVGCGSAYHAGVVYRHAIERLARIPVRVELASEFRYEDPIVEENTLLIAISQSGETADTLAAVREAKRRGVRTLAVVNVQGSSLAREADNALFTMAGAEIAVATTKAYSAQLAVGYLLALELARLRGGVSQEEYAHALGELFALPEGLRTVLSRKEEYRRFAREHLSLHDVFMIGRGADYAVCMEGGLKLKEVSYLHTEAYAAGELKHGAISLVEDGTVVVGVVSQSAVGAKTVSNLEEVKARGARVVLVLREGCPAETDPAWTVWTVPPVDEVFAASLLIVPLQLLSYYMSVELGHDVDKPRNLAKSVTVE